MRSFVFAVLVLLVLGGLGGIGLIYSGLFDVAATAKHGDLVTWVLHTTARHSIARRAKDITIPDLSQPEVIARGLVLFRDNCAECHGAPGIAPHAFALGLTPVPPRLEQVGREWPANEMFWTIDHGIKMTAMPAWEYRLAREDIWAIVAFLRTLPNLSPRAYQATAREAGQEPELTHAAFSPMVLPSPSASRGKRAVEQYACVTCHDIPGIAAPEAGVGPSLADIARRSYIAGFIENRPDTLFEWIRHPQQIKPGTAMPNLGISSADALDIVAYLETLR